MRSRKRSYKPALKFILFALLCALTGQTADARSPVNFRLVKGCFVVIPVRVNGAGPFDFLLDTGTNTTLITPELARRLGLSAAGQVSLITPSGATATPRAVLDSLALGTKSVERLEVLYDGLPGVRSADAKILGVLGQNFLSCFNYLLDYRKRQIAFEEDGDLGNLAGGTRLRVERQEGKLIVNTQATAPSKETWRLVLDSGASGLVLFAPPFVVSEPARRAEGFLTPTDAARIPASRGRLRGLRVGDERLFDVPFALVRDCPSREDRSEDGLLPTCLFKAILFQNDRDVVVLNPRAE